MSNEQKPSAEDMSKALVAARTLAKCANVAEMADDLAQILARVRREARAEAFKSIEDELRAEGRTVSADYVEELAAKERAS